MPKKLTPWHLAQAAVFLCGLWLFSGALNDKTLSPTAATMAFLGGPALLTFAFATATLWLQLKPFKTAMVLLFPVVVLAGFVFSGPRWLAIPIGDGAAFWLSAVLSAGIVALIALGRRLLAGRHQVARLDDSTQGRISAAVRDEAPAHLLSTGKGLSLDQ
jgi:hypothetical protein